MAEKHNVLQLNLFDPESDTTYQLFLPKEDYQRAFTDPRFAQSLLFHAKATRSIQVEESRFASNEETAERNPTTNGVEEDGDENMDQNDEEIGSSTSNGLEKHSWAYNESVALIQSMANHMEDLTHPKKKKYVFVNVANDLCSQGFTVTATMCSVKWKNLLRSYKTAKDNKTKTGRGPSRFLFFDAMDGLLGEKPANKCAHTLESSSIDNLSDCGVEEEDAKAKPTNEINNNSKKTPNKRRGGKENFILMKKEEYAKRQRRHDERVALTERKLAQEDRKIALLEKLMGNGRV